MTLEDISDVMAIEKTAFPIPWPEQAYRHEILDNPNGYFIVVRLRHAESVNAPRNLLQRLAGGSAPLHIRGLSDRLPTPAPQQPIIGFAGLWMFVDEGHISTIASQTGWRGQGVGELLLMTLLREAQRRNAIMATLEVRVSNAVAQNLYRKYGFTEVGRRKRYYQDNGEDALIMTVENFTTPDYHTTLDALEAALWQRLGI